MQDRHIRFALIGAGFIGRVHGLALGAVNSVFSDGPRAVRTVLVDKDPALAERQARQLGFAEWTSDWEAALDKVDAMILAVPSHMHRDIALAAAARGKHILCEKPVGRSTQEAELIASSTREAGVSNGVGFTYLRAPMVLHAAGLVDSGVLGRPVSFSGWHAEDYLADPEAPFSWRLDAALAGRCGVLGDLGWHIVSIARRLCGPIDALTGMSRTVYASRPDGGPASARRNVENEDWAGMLVRFGAGAVGTIEASRVAHGRKMDIGFHLTCEKGAITFHGERANELRIYEDGDVAAAGFRTVHINAAHSHYGAFLPAPAHGLGFNDLKTIEIHEFLLAIAERRNLYPDLDEACRIARICEAVVDSSAQGARIEAPEAAVPTPTQRKK